MTECGGLVCLYCKLTDPVFAFVDYFVRCKLCKLGVGEVFAKGRSLEIGGNVYTGIALGRSIVSAADYQSDIIAGRNIGQLEDCLLYTSPSPRDP